MGDEATKVASYYTVPCSTLPVVELLPGSESLPRVKASRTDLLLHVLGYVLGLLAGRPTDKRP